MRGEQTCSRCKDDVHTLSSRGWCDGCETERFEPRDERYDQTAITVSRGQLDEWAGRELTDEELAAVAHAWTWSSIPEAFQTIIDSLEVSDGSGA